MLLKLLPELVLFRCFIRLLVLQVLVKCIGIGLSSTSALHVALLEVLQRKTVSMTEESLF